MDISAIEAVPVEHLDPTLVSEGVAEVARRQAAPAANDMEKAEIAIHQEVYQAMNNALNKTK